MRKWFKADLTSYEWDYLKSFLKEEDIIFRTNGSIKGFIQVEIYSTELETDMINKYISKLYQF